MSGTVFDIGYQNYAGEREGLNRSQMAVFKDGVRIALGLGRGPRAKVLPWFFIAVLAAIGLLLAVIAGTVERLVGPGASANMPSHADLYDMGSIFIFVFAALVAPELLCRDRREGTINLYLVRPLGGGDYLVARYAAFLAVITAAVWLPQIILFLGLWMDAPDPVQYIRYYWIDIARFLVAGLAMGAYVTSIAMLTASFTTRRAYASVFLVGLFVISTPFTVGVASEIEGPVGQWISMLNLNNIPLYVNAFIFDDSGEMTEDAPAQLLPAPVRAAWYLAWTFIPAVILWWRYRRLTP